MGCKHGRTRPCVAVQPWLASASTISSWPNRTAYNWGTPWVGFLFAGSRCGRIARTPTLPAQAGQPLARANHVGSIVGMPLVSRSAGSNDTRSTRIQALDVTRVLSRVTRLLSRVALKLSRFISL